jgi:hypothetical protein
LQIVFFVFGFVTLAAELSCCTSVAEQRIKELLVATELKAASAQRQYNYVKETGIDIFIVVIFNVFFEFIIPMEAWARELIAGS